MACSDARSQRKPAGPTLRHRLAGMSVPHKEMGEDICLGWACAWLKSVCQCSDSSQIPSPTGPRTCSLWKAVAWARTCSRTICPSSDNCSLLWEVRVLALPGRDCARLPDTASGACSRKGPKMTGSCSLATAEMSLRDMSWSEGNGTEGG